MPALQRRLLDRSSDPQVSTGFNPQRFSIEGLSGSSGIDLNALGEPALVVDRSGLVLAANSAMRGVLGNHIRIQNQRLRLSDAHARARFDALLQAMKTQSDMPDIDRSR